MTVKLRIEYVRLRRIGDGAGQQSDIIVKVLGSAEVMTVTAVNAQSAARPAFAAERGMSADVYARLMPMGGAVTVEVAANPTSDETEGFRIENGEEKLLLIKSGQKIGAVLAAAIPGVGAISTSAAITAHNVTTFVPGRKVAVVCTVAGDVKLGFADGSTLTVPVAVGLTILDLAANQVFVTGTTATATYATLN